MKFQIDLTVTLETDETGSAVLADQPSVCITAIRAKPTTAEDEKSDLLGPVPEKPNGRTGIDKDLTDLIDYFREHPKRPTAYVPNWAKDKNHLRPYVLAKGATRIREMLDAFVMREHWDWNTTDPSHRQYFNAKCVLGQPLTIQGFIAAADRLDVLLAWETPEVPYG